MGRPADIRLSFDEASDVYDRARPSYPSELFDTLFEMLPSEPQIVEVGPGTGKATTDLLARGASVLAVEIGPALAAALRSKVPSEHLTICIGDFESVDIPTGRADAVFSASAYHWISPQAQTGRPAEILRPGGMVAIVDLIQVDSPADAGFFAAVQPIYDRYGEGHKGPPTPPRPNADPGIRTVLEQDSRFGSVAVHRWDWDQTYTAAGYRDLMLSYSGTQMMDEAARTGLLNDIESFIRNHFGGSVTRPLVATLTTATLA